MTDYTRVTIIGSRRKADLALPDDHPVEELLPELLELLDEPPAAGSPLTMTTLAGTRIDGGSGLSEQGIRHGAILRLLPLDDAPQPPDIAEVTEAVAEAALHRPDRWTSRLSALAISVVVAVSAAITGGALPVSGPTATLLLVGIFVLAAAGGVFLARRDRARKDRMSGWTALLGLCLGLSLPLGSHIGALADGSGSLAVAVTTIWTLSWLAVTAIVGIGGGQRGFVAGASVAVLTLLVVLGSAILAIPAPMVAAVSAVVIAAALGVIPAMALANAGVTRFDDDVIDGGTVTRASIESAIGTAFATQTALAVALSLPLAVAVYVLEAGGIWHLALAAAVVVFVFARSRLFPLAVPRTALLLAAGVPVILWIWTSTILSEPMRILIGLLVCAVFVLVALLRPSAPAQARVRRLLNTIEMIAVVVFIPLLLGTFGIYSDLLGAFS